MNTEKKASASGSDAGCAMSTPIRRAGSGCCARTFSGHGAAAPPSRAMKSRRLMGPIPRRARQLTLVRLFVQPDVLKARAIVDAVDHADQILDVGPPAGDAAHVQDVRARIFFDQLPLDLPNQLPPLVGAQFPRLAVDQLVDRFVAIAGVIAHRAAFVILIEWRIGIVDL